VSQPAVLAVGAGLSGLVESFGVALMPIVMLLLLRKVLKAAGFGNITGLGGSLGFLTKAAMRASGDRDLSRAARQRPGQRSSAADRALGLDRTDAWGSKKFKDTSRAAWNTFKARWKATSSGGTPTTDAASPGSASASPIDRTAAALAGVAGALTGTAADAARAEFNFADPITDPDEAAHVAREALDRSRVLASASPEERATAAAEYARRAEAAARTAVTGSPDLRLVDEASIDAATAEYARRWGVPPDGVVTNTVGLPFLPHPDHRHTDGVPPHPIYDLDPVLSRRREGESDNEWTARMLGELDARGLFEPVTGRVVSPQAVVDVGEIVGVGAAAVSGAYTDLGADRHAQVTAAAAQANAALRDQFATLTDQLERLASNLGRTPFGDYDDRFEDWVRRIESSSSVSPERWREMHRQMVDDLTPMVNGLAAKYGTVHEMAAAAHLPAMAVGLDSNAVSALASRLAEEVRSGQHQMASELRKALGDLGSVAPEHLATAVAELRRDLERASAGMANAATVAADAARSTVSGFLRDPAPASVASSRPTPARDVFS